MSEQTEIQRRLVQLEKAFLNLSHRIESVTALAGKASQDGGTGGGGSIGGAGSPLRLCYTTTGVSPRSGNTAGSGEFQFVVVNSLGNMAATGDPADSRVTGVNVTGSTGPNGAYGIVSQIGPFWYFLVLDCYSTTAPAAPASAPVAGA